MVKHQEEDAAALIAAADAERLRGVPEGSLRLCAELALALSDCAARMRKALGVTCEVTVLVPASAWPFGEVSNAGFRGSEGAAFLVKAPPLRVDGSQ